VIEKRLPLASSLAVTRGSIKPFLREVTDGETQLRGIAGWFWHAG